MPSPPTDGKALTFDDVEDASDSGSFSDSSSGPGSDSDSNSGSDSISGTDGECGSSTKPQTGANNPPLSRDELLAYLENMRQRFSTKPTSDSFADQDEEVLIVASKKKLGRIQHLNAPRLTGLPGAYQN